MNPRQDVVTVSTDFVERLAIKMGVKNIELSAPPMSRLPRVIPV